MAGITDLEQEETVAVGGLRAALDPTVTQQALRADPERHILAGNVTIVVVVQLDRRVRGQGDAKAAVSVDGSACGGRPHNGVQARVERGNVLAAAGEVQVVVPGRVAEGLVEFGRVRLGALPLGLRRLGLRRGRLLGGRHALGVGGDAAAVLQRAGDEDSLPLVALAFAAAGEALAAVRALIGALRNARGWC